MVPSAYGRLEANGSASNRFMDISEIADLNVSPDHGLVMMWPDFDGVLYDMSTLCHAVFRSILQSPVCH